MTKQQFITKEIATWGQDYIFDLIDRGYDAVELHDTQGRMKWSWVLTQPQKYATMGYGSVRRYVAPVSYRGNRAYG